MSRYNSMPMPQPGRNSSSNYGPPPSSNYGPTSYAPYPAANTAMTNDSAMDREMNTLIENLKISIQDASAEDLDTLLKNEDTLNTLIEDSPQMKDLKAKRNELINGNNKQATFNLSLQGPFESQKEKLSEVVMLQSSKKEEYDILKSKLESLAGSLSLDTTLALLQTSAAEKDAASEALANDLLDGKLQIDEFLEQYVSERTVYHLRKIKADKMAEIVRRGPPNQQHGPTSYYGAGYARY